MMKLAACSVAAAVTIAVLAATNPSAADHRRLATLKAQERCAAMPFGKAICGNLVEFAATRLAYRNWRLFSTGQLGDMETFGALGQVVVVKEGG